MFRLATALCAFAFLPALAAAQTHSGPYASLGMQLDRKEVLESTAGAGLQLTRQWLPAPTAAVGVFINRFVGIEAEGQRESQQTFPYTYTYSGPVTHRTGTHRDSRLLANVRVRAICRWVCVEGVAGFGLGFHHTSSFINTECGPVGVSTPCTAVNKEDWNETERMKTATFGVDFRVGSPSSRVSVVPSFRLNYLRHYDDQHLAGRHEVMAVGNRWILSFGATLSVR